MRGAFVRTLVELADRDRRIALLTGDLGYMALEPFMERQIKWHYWPMSDDEYRQALADVERAGA